MNPRSTHVRTAPAPRPSTVRGTACPTVTIMPFTDADEERAWDEIAAMRR